MKKSIMSDPVVVSVSRTISESKKSKTSISSRCCNYNYGKNSSSSGEKYLEYKKRARQRSRNKHSEYKKEKTRTLGPDESRDTKSNNELKKDLYEFDFPYEFIIMFFLGATFCSLFFFLLFG